MNDNFSTETKKTLIVVLDELSIYEIKNNLAKYSFFALLRHLESSLTHQAIYKRVGESHTPKQDLFRIYQNPSLSFSYRNIDEVDIKDNKIHLAINEVGLLGTNSPLPGYLIEYIYQRKHHFGDSSWESFVNMLQQRILALFYRSWMNAQSVASLEYRGSDQFSRYISSLIGLAGLNKERNVGDVDYYSKLYFSGYYFQKNKSKTNLESLLSQYFKLPVSIKENMGRWFNLPKKEQTKVIARGHYNLGNGLVLGDKVFDTQTKIRIVIGPIALKECETFYDGDVNAKRISEWVRLYLGVEFDWDVQLILKRESVPPTILNAKSRFGCTTYVGKVSRDVDDIILRYKNP